MRLKPTEQFQTQYYYLIYLTFYRNILYLQAQRGVRSFHETDSGQFLFFQIIASDFYKPYGEVVREASSGPDNFRYKYAGQEADTESSLIRMGARMYDPTIGRFIQLDVKNSGRGFDVQSFNRYMYVRGNPMEWVDVSGFSWWDDMWGTVGDVVSTVVSPVTAAVSAVQSAFTGQNFADTFKSNFNSVSGFAGALAQGIATAGLAIAATGLFLSIGAGFGSVWGSATIFGESIAGTALLGGTLGGSLAAARGENFWKGFGSGAAGGAVTGLLGPGSSKVISGINGFLAGYNDIYSDDDIGAQALLGDSTIGLPTTGLGMGKAILELTGGAHYEKGFSRGSNAFIFTNSIFARSNAVGNVVSIDKKITGIGGAAFNRTLREELLHTWQYRKGGLLNQARLLLEQINSDPQGVPYPYDTPGTLEFEAQTRSFFNFQQRPWELSCVSCGRFY